MVWKQPCAKFAELSNQTAQRVQYVNNQAAAVASEAAAAAAAAVATAAKVAAAAAAARTAAETAAVHSYMKHATRQTMDEQICGKALPEIVQEIAVVELLKEART